MAPTTQPTPSTTKRVFSALVAVVLLGLLGHKAWEIFVEPRMRAHAYLGVEPADGAAPPFELKTRDGKVLRLADFRGKTVFLNFWATWCESCRVEMPSLNYFAQQFKGRQDFVVLAASQDDGWEPIDQMLNGFQPDFQIALDPGAEIAKKYGTFKLPETWIIGPEGRLRAKFIGPRDWSDAAFTLYFQQLLANR